MSGREAPTFATLLERRLWALLCHARQAFAAQDRRALLVELNDLEATLQLVREALAAPAPEKGGRHA